MAAAREEIEEVSGFDLQTGFRPEAMIAGSEPNRVQIFGDAVDGNGPLCPDDDTPAKDRRFRSVDVTITP